MRQKRHFVGHLPETKEKALELYFKIERHFAQHHANGGGGLRLQEVAQMAGLKSNSTTLVYVRLLAEWGLINHHPNKVGTITLANKNYPPVAWRKDVHKKEAWEPD